MDRWDVFHSDRLEVLRGLSTLEVQAAWTEGEIRDDDLIRPAGSTQPWARLADEPALKAPVAEAPTETAPSPEPTIAPPDSSSSYDVDEPGAQTPARPPNDVSVFDFNVDRIERHADQLDQIDPFGTASFEAVGIPPDLPRTPISPPAAGLPAQASLPAAPEQAALTASFPTADILDFDDDWDPQDEDEEVASFTLAEATGRPVEELDLTAMVDVSFQLILFFLITATAIYLKTLEIPRPNPDPSEAAAIEPRTLEELESDYILVGIDDKGGFTIDRQPVAATESALAEGLREARRESGRTAMLLTAETEALHRYAVLAYDAANAIGLRITIATPPRGRSAPAG